MSGHESSAKSRAILEQRARQLAIEPIIADAGETTVLVEFTLAHERFALSARFVREVAVAATVTPLPNTPEFVLGLVNLRGEIVSVMDIRSFFGLPPAHRSGPRTIVFVQDEQMVFGVAVDEVSTDALPLAAIQPPLPTLSGLRAKYVTGITKDRVTILDGARLLTDPEIVVRDQLTARPGRGNW